jgi:hypothetical protein
LRINAYLIVTELIERKWRDVFSKLHIIKKDYSPSSANDRNVNAFLIDRDGI